MKAQTGDRLKPLGEVSQQAKRKAAVTKRNKKIKVTLPKLSQP